MTNEHPIKPRTLVPREHGAYGQLGAPLVAAMCLAGMMPAAWGYAGAAVAVFLAHEPWLVLLGHRGARAMAAERGRAQGRIVALLFAALAGAAVGVIGGPWPAVVGTAAPLVPALALVPVILAEKEKTLLGESLAAAAMAGAAVPVALAGQVPVLGALGAWIGFGLGFAGTNVAVKAMVAHHKTRPEVAPPAVASWLGGLTAAAAVGAGLVAWEALAAVPLLVVSWVVGTVKPHPRHVRRVGWLLAAASALAATVVVVAGRGVGR